jgi:hypothetical protein
MGTAFQPGLDGGRLFHPGWMGTAFSPGLNEDGFSPELNGDGFFIWVEWGRLFHLN